MAHGDVNTASPTASHGTAWRRGSHYVSGSEEAGCELCAPERRRCLGHADRRHDASFSHGFLRKAAEPRDSREVSEANVTTLACLLEPMAPTHGPPPLRVQPSGARSELCPFLSSQQYSGGGRRDLKRA